MDNVEIKARAVREMFSSIAHRYDFLNHLLSFGMDIRWRKRAVRCFGGLESKRILDVACGTGDLAIALAGAGAEVVGGDFSGEMIAIGEEKVTRKGLSDRVRLERADALNLPYADAEFDGVTCAFGVRNFADLDRGLREMARTMKKGGRVVILEFTTPANPFMAALYRLYFTGILPVIGGIVSGRKSAYEYLPDSVYKFPAPPELAARMEAAGFANVAHIPLTLGICGIHTGVKG